MIEKSTETTVRFCTLVEHPAGPDGGEFPHYEEYGVAKDGSVYYSSDYPESPTDTFCDAPANVYVTVEDRPQALSVLQQELEEARRHVAALEHLVDAFAVVVDFKVYFGDEPYGGPFEEDDAEPQDPDDLDDEEDEYLGD